MGLRCHWLAVQGRDRDDVLAHVHMKLVGELIEPVYDPGLFALEVGDWLVLIGDGQRYATDVKRAHAATLSGSSDSIYVSIDDDVMTFELAIFRDREELWSVTYDGRDGVTAPVFAGTVPFQARVLLARLEKLQAQAGGPKAERDHIYELAPIYAKELTGFRHDESLGSGDHVPVWQLATS